MRTPLSGQCVLPHCKCTDLPLCAEPFWAAAGRTGQCGYALDHNLGFSAPPTSLLLSESSGSWQVLALLCFSSTSCSMFPWLTPGTGAGLQRKAKVGLRHIRAQRQDPDLSPAWLEQPHPSDAAGTFPPACSPTGTGIHSLESAASLCWACRKEDFKNCFFSSLCLGYAVHFLN